MMAPAVILLLGWMLAPLTTTLYFSFKKYLPLRGGDLGWVGFDNNVRIVTTSSFWPSVYTTLICRFCFGHHRYIWSFVSSSFRSTDVGSRDRAYPSHCPFFVMPTVSGLVWKNMFMDPINGILAHLWRFFGLQPLEWLSQFSMGSIILIVSWQWLPFSTLILLTAIQSLDREQLEAAEMDGANPTKRFGYIILPHFLVRSLLSFSFKLFSYFQFLPKSLSPRRCLWN